MQNTQGMRKKYMVIKNEDMDNYLTQYGRELIQQGLIQIHLARLEEGKSIDNQYIVVNTDEPYAEEIIEILKRNGHWG